VARRPIVHVELPVAEVETAEKFYGALFHWKFSRYPDQSYATFEAGAVSGALNLVEDGLTEPGRPLIFVGSRDIDADLAKARALGGETLIPRTPIPGVGWYAILLDPAGNRIGLLATAS
jgi:predicted enzyme related to lactoylglutathione lyase